MTKLGNWRPLGRVAPDRLPEARLQLHWAAQTVAAVGKTYLQPRPDDSHPNLGWNSDLEALAGHPTPAPHGFQAALRISDLSLMLLDERGTPLADKPLHGCSMDDAYEWLARTLRSSTGADKAIIPPGYDLPSHPVSQGSAFSLDSPPAFAEMARWFANAARALGQVQAEFPEASPVRCWPHHFDIATLISLDPGKDAESARSIGVGMTPGDRGYPHPYWYVTPWPYPKDLSRLPLAGGGRWHTEGWTGAVLEASQLISDQSATGQARRLEQFLRSAIEGSFKSLG